jgi:Putative MetA-pathway of phenol degradation
MTAFVVAASAGSAPAQELDPNAYMPAPVGLNILSIATTISSGDLSFDPSGPISEASSTISTTALLLGRTLSVGGRSGNVSVVMPYVIGNVRGKYLGLTESVQRSGPADFRLRVAANLYGAPAMTVREFASYRHRTVVGTSLTVVAPLGQYSSRKLINIGTKRWAFKPEVGLARVSRRWIFETYAGVWLFTANGDFLGHRVREQRPIASAQFHVEYVIRPGMWLAGNVNFYAGGRTIVDGIPNIDLQKNSRVGATWFVPLVRGHAVRLAVSRGAYTTIGADFTSVSAVYQYVWRGR